MSSSSLRVLIVGGGLGGLCLAQGLQQAGVSVAAYERDATPIFRQQGYRLHIDQRGAAALRACLPSHLCELFVATTSHPGRQITVLTKQLKQRKVIGLQKMEATEPASLNTAIDRLTLRDILLAGLENTVHFNKEFCRYELQEDGVRAFFADGTEASGDVLVAADGVNSRIRQQFLPDAVVTDTGLRCIYGKTRLSQATRPLIPAPLHQGFTMVIGLPFTMALGLVEFLHSPAEAAAQLAPSVQLRQSSDYLMWSLNAARSHLTVSDEELLHLDGQRLQQVVLDKMKHWHPNLRALIAASDPAEIFPIAVRVSTLCEPWQSTHITLLGDAIHAMSPAGGSGANMALQDAHLLCQSLICVAHGEKPLIPAIHEYETRMLTDGFEAVSFSAQGGVFHTATSPKKSLFQTIFPFTHRS
ncbi:MAG: FAD-dependent monooxygenase [Chloroflexota bacterium]|nr:FAD-dependent monooxygenase [Chloroflexota bacterium]